MCVHAAAIRSLPNYFGRLFLWCRLDLGTPGGWRPDSTNRLNPRSASLVEWRWKMTAGMSFPPLHLTTSEQFLTTCPQQSSYDVVRRITHLQRYKQSFLTCRTSSDSFRSRYSLDRVFSVVSSFSCFKIARDYSMSYAVVGPITMSRASPLRDNL